MTTKVKTSVAECRGGPKAGKLVRQPSDIEKFMVPELTPIGMEYHVYRLTAGPDRRPFWKYEGIDAA